jgi:glycosyltransferase involved in cell wall biosynthesis
MQAANINRSPMHLIGQFDHPFRGAELAHLDLADLLSPHRPVNIWSTAPPHPSLKMHKGMAVQTIAPYLGRYPRGGTLIAAGVHFDLGVWLKLGAFDRVILVCNIPNNTAILDRVHQVYEALGRMPELSYVSEVQKISVGLPGIVHPVPMQLADFWALERRYESKPYDRLCLGRLSRDVLQKHDPRDVALYRSLSARGMTVRIVGGTCLRPQLGELTGIELLPEGALSPLELLAGLDIYFYRTGPTTEMFGRVIWDAMASGLPLVLQAHGGYSAWIEHGKHAILVESQEQAYAAIKALSEQPEDVLEPSHLTMACVLLVSLIATDSFIAPNAADWTGCPLESSGTLNRPEGLMVMLIYDASADSSSPGKKSVDSCSIAAGLKS